MRNRIDGRNYKKNKRENEDEEEAFYTREAGGEAKITR